MRYLQLPHSTLGLASLFTVLAVGAQAATFEVIPLDGGLFQAPDGLLFDQLNTGLGTNVGPYDERDVRSNRGNAQSFTFASGATLDKIAINYFGATLSASDTATFEFFSVSNAQASTLTPLTLLDSVSFTSADLGQSGGTLVFDVTDTAAQAGDSFAIRFVTSSAQSAGVFKWNFFGAFEDGARYENGNLVNDDEFYSIGLIGTATIPEPSSAAALLGGAVALLAATRRRRR